jgi:hypothetical protein
MKTNRWIVLSLRCYRQLLRLYPQAYRAIYEMEMLRVFTNQCREAYQLQDQLGILLLWSRTLIDLAVTIVREHLSDPQAKVGLLEAMPNTPLPWKGVLLVLIPGLLFFVGAIERLTETNEWFFLAFYLAGYFLILPVLLVWLLTRRFPIWGLIPFGLLYRTLESYSPSYLIDKLPYFLIAVSACAVLLCGLIWHDARHQGISRGAWKWLGLYGLLVVLQIARGIIAEIIAREFAWQNLGWQTILYSIEMKQVIVQIILWFLYTPLSLLLLVFIGKVFSRKYGGLSFLILLGYLLPTVIFERYDTWNDPVPFYLVGIVLFVYRFVVALVAPVWLVRAASLASRQRAAAIPVAIAIICHISPNVIVSPAWGNATGYQTLLDLAAVIWEQLMIAAGLGLAVALYLRKKKDQAVLSPPTLVPTTE